MSGEPTIERTAIPGLLVLRLPVHADERGWFKENWQRQKMLALGLPDFGPVQNNVSFNARRGATRGFHAEPWDKLVSVASGRVLAAWVDLRAGDSFGSTVTVEIDPGVAVFVPRGVGNAYQALEDATAYTYLVNGHWRADMTYPALDLADPDLGVAWPVPLDVAEVSAKDRANPRLAEIEPVPARRALVLGAGGQLGRALMAAFPGARGVTRAELDLADPAAVADWAWHEHDTVLNAAAHTGVDAAEQDRAVAWALNASAPAQLAGLAARHGFTLVHYSTDYVFDGTRAEHPEDEPLSPLGVYGQSKAAGEVAVGTAPRHYVLRTSWLVGEGPNFVRTMCRLAREGVSPSVVDDQVGRLTFADELARATRHLLEVAAAYGTYHVTNAGPPTSWADVARQVFELCGRDPRDVTPVSTQEYAAGRALAPRPPWSTLSSSRLEATGFVPGDAGEALRRYLSDDPVSAG
ncbi:dTDP-4-dehydrorhamnose reductase [Nocardioides donggukensis]|uniref:dTDP-4-dehydrorhamnose reductase n=1 Tax=Nocardioides donggukensis TaxID=2774019 RepID=A0A927PZ32_9ACTN|nr:dTDP-4-dehydrorhamnose reductase [Nocardioides donggukensis]MBD8868335.1 dTDP-4-dehydrorhamnose reductase [Nocardioides donggukensis]